MTQRRDFLKQASLLAAAGSVLPAALDAQPVPVHAAPAITDTPASLGEPPQQTQYDMSWTAKVNGKYKMAFDCPDIAGGISLHQVRSFLSGYNATLGLTDADLSAVLIVRHAAVPMVLGDDLWADAPWGADQKLKDPVTGEVTKRNPFINVPADAKFSDQWADGTLDKLMQRGVVVLACDLALNAAASGLSRRRSIPMQDARDLITKNLLPGVYRMPSGIFGTCAAQGLGCGVFFT